MNSKTFKTAACFAVAVLFSASAGFGQMGKRFPSEKKIVPDPVTGVPLTFLTTAGGDSKIYQTHRQWTADGKWVIFRSGRVPGQAFAANEETGDIVQVTETGYSGMLCAAHKSMKLFIMRNPGGNAGRGGRGGRGGTNAPAGGTEAAAGSDTLAAQTAGSGTNAPGARGGRGGGGRGGQQVVEIDLERLFADSAAGTLKAATNYERICGTLPPGINSGGNMGLDANDDFMYFSVTGPDTAQLSEGMQLEKTFGPRSMGAGPSGLRSMNLKTGEVKLICNVGFQIGHVQSNPWNPGEIVFCWETGGKAPQRTWTVMADGTGLRPLYPEAPYEWITHEAVIGKDEVAIAILCHRRPGTGVNQTDSWGASGTAEHPSGVAVVNLRTREMRIAGQVPLGNQGRSDWHVGGSSDGRWAAFDDFQYRLWLVDRHTGETVLLADVGHKAGSAADHIHPTFSADNTRIEIQTAMLSEDGRLNICIVPVPKTWLARTYSAKLPE